MIDRIRDAKLGKKSLAMVDDIRKILRSLRSQGFTPTLPSYHDGKQGVFLHHSHIRHLQAFSKAVEERILRKGGYSLPGRP